jgi:hypothetical protein
MSRGEVSPQSRQSLERLLRRAVQSRLILQPDHNWTMSRSEAEPGAAATSDTVVVLTISSMRFRLLLLLRFSGDAGTHAYYTRGEESASLRDALLETGNLCCGAINQDLVKHFPDLGMSTPYLLSGPSLQHIGSLQADYRADFDVAIGEAPAQLGITVCMFASGTIDFTVSETAETEEADDGGLELF